MKINHFRPDEHIYSQILTHIADAPKRLYIIGLLPTERRVSVAIVGTRKPTSYGKEVTYQIAYELAKRGVVIVSGLALGVDGIAHRAALDAGGTTIAVLGNGLPRIYPASHRQLAQEIVQKGGAILSEYEPETPSYPNQFLERNRIVSGLSDAVLITEATLRSGTMSTAAHALGQGKDVAVVPGNITSPSSAGCNTLLRQGATPITRPEDVLELIAPELLDEQTSLTLTATPEEAAVLELLKAGTRDGDELQRQSNLAPHVFSTTLTMLEINGHIRSLGGNQWSLK